MAKSLSMEETKNIIKNYIKDDRKKQAVLLNGEWGCGKTFFIKEKLIPEFDLSEYQILQISLYGISSTERIQEIIYGKLIEQLIDNDKLRSLGRRMGIFGKSAIQLIEKLVEKTMNDKNSSAEIAKTIIDQKLLNNKTILIFDDIERCRIEIIELMGFLNNLSENNNYKLILIANEKEITRDEDSDTMALKYGIALNERLDIKKFVKNDKNKDKKINRDNLVEITNYYFGRTTAYERTREKLIGITVPYSISIKESFDDIISKYINDNSISEIVKKNKDRIFDLFESQEHKNLRTLIASCIAVEDILSSIDQNKFIDIDMVNDELDTIVIYTVYSAIRRTMGKGEYIWLNGTRYGKVNNSLYGMNDSKIYGYAFVDEYWKTQCIDVDIIHLDIEKRISERIEYENEVKRNSNYQTLALHKLKMWYILNDDVINKLLIKLKEELMYKKYYPQDFKDIITILQCIDNPNYGLKRDKKNRKTSILYDTTDSSQFIGMNLDNQKTEQHINFKWEKIDITSYVELMVKYLDDPKFNLTKNMLRVLTEDKQFAYNYRQLIMPLIEKVEKKELHDALQGIQDDSILNMKWDNDFEEYCCDNRSEFHRLGRFLSLFDFEELTKKLANADAEEVYYFRNSVENVYCLSNFIDIHPFSLDYEIVKLLRDYISSNIDNLLNKNKSRTKAIWLKQLEYNLKKYELSLEKKKNY